MHMKKWAQRPPTVIYDQRQRLFRRPDGNPREQGAKELGLEIVAKEAGNTGDKDFKAQLTNIKAANRISYSSRITMKPWL